VLYTGAPKGPRKIPRVKTGTGSRKEARVAAMLYFLRTCTGGANTNDALLRSIELLVRQEELDPLATRVSMILLITGSDPTAGVADTDRILSNIRQASCAV